MDLVISSSTLSLEHTTNKAPSAIPIITESFTTVSTLPANENTPKYTKAPISNDGTNITHPTN
jgi:hypothetical protein